MTDVDRVQEIERLHEKFYEQSLVFQVLRAAPDCDAALDKTRQLIVWIYSRIRRLP